MSKIFKGNVGIGKGTHKGAEVLKLKKNVDGAFNSENAKELLAKALELSKAKSLPLFCYSFYIPSEKRPIEQSDLKLIDEGKFEPVLQADQWGNPALRLMEPNKKYSSKRKTNSFEWLA
tara:strand:- start:271 stop:627 length:357 start_codon:yes stop_codon:yes gene_type:complete